MEHCPGKAVASFDGGGAQVFFSVAFVIVAFPVQVVLFADVFDVESYTAAAGLFGETGGLAEIIVNLLPGGIVGPEGDVAVKCDFDKILCDALFEAFIIAGFYPLKGFVVFTAGGDIAVGGPDIIGEVSHNAR